MTPGTPGDGLEVTGLEVVLDGAPVLRGADLRVAAGRVAVVLGPSGSGKSTLLRAIAGLERPVAGAVVCDGADLTPLPVHRRGVALMFQDGQLFGHLSVARNVEYALRRRRVPRAERAARVGELLDLVGLAGFGDRAPATLSGGERQRVALARALAARPRLLLLDEPLSALDAGLRERLAADLRGILREAGTTTVMVTHDRAEAVALADHVAVMRDGVVVQQGTATSVWGAPVDVATARFLGHTVLTGAAARRVLAAAGAVPAGTASAGAVALRAGALRLAADGVLTGVVQERHPTPDGERLAVAVPDLGVLPVAGPDAGLDAGLDAGPDAGSAAGPAVGASVRLAVVASRVVLLPAPPGASDGAH